MRPSRRYSLSAAHARSEEVPFRERNSALARKGRRRGGGAMSDSSRDRVLMQALSEVPNQGFTDAVLTVAAERAGVGKREMLDAFPRGPESLVEAFSHWADAQMSAAMANDTSERVRDRVRNAV